MAHKLVLRKILKVPNNVDNLWRHYDSQDLNATFNRAYWSICQAISSEAWNID